MQTIEEIRVENLRRLVREYGSQAALARALGKHPNQVNQWTGKGSDRAMHSNSAREIEELLKKPRGWMDNPETQPLRLDPLTVGDARQFVGFLMGGKAVFDPFGDVDLFVRAYRHMTDDPGVSRDDLIQAVNAYVAARQGGSDGEADAGRGNVPVSRRGNTDGRGPTAGAG